MIEPPTYLAHVESRLNQANQMITKYLVESTRSPLITIIEDTLLRPHLGALISKGSLQMFDQNKASDLKRLYQMCKRVQMMKSLKDSWTSYLRNTGESLIQSSQTPQNPSDQQSEKDLIEQLLQFQVLLSYHSPLHPPYIRIKLKLFFNSILGTRTS